MSGLCGWIGGPTPDEKAQAAIRRMSGRLAADRVDRTEIAPAGRAAIRAAGPPMVASFSAEGRLVAAILGYPRWSSERLAGIAAERGHAAALAAAWCEHGPDLLSRLHGEFAVALLDPEARRALLAIDRFGIRALSFARPRPDLLVFGTSTDLVAAHPEVGSTISPQTLYDFLYFVDRVPAPDTIYDEQTKLLPGECLLYEAGRIERRRYWRMPYSTANSVSYDALAAELRERLGTAVARSLEGETPGAVGAFLSGGLDSSTVSGFFARQTSGAARTFTIGFDEKGFDESEYARIAAEHFGTRHTEYFVTPKDVYDAIPRITEFYDEPHANSSAVPAYHCARIARESGVETMLAGDGGDELFAGNSRYVEDRFFDRYAGLPRFVRRGVIAPALATLPRNDPLDILRRARNHARIGDMSLPVRMYRHNVYWAVPPDRIFAADALVAIDPDRPARLLRDIFDDTEGGDPVQAMMHVDLRLTIADSDLRKVCGMCEAAGVRVRFPMLDDDLAEFSARVPPTTLMAGGALRAFYKKAMTGFLPDAIIAKKKHGFGLPLMQHLKAHAPTEALIGDTITALKSRPYFRPDCLDAVLADHRAGAHDRFGAMVWDLLLLELWMQEHYDR